MRILHVTDCYLPRIGGIEMHVRDLCRAQRDAGHDARVVTATSADQETGPDEAWVHRLGPRSTSIGSSVAGGADLARLLELHRPDVVHAHVSVFSPFAVRAARQASGAGVPTLVTVHSMWRGAVLPVMRPLLLGLAAEPVAWSAVSARAAGPVRAVLPGQLPVLVLPNAVDPGWWRQEPAPTAGVPTIVSVMRLARRKRPLALARMLRRVRAELPDELPLRAVIVGDGPQRAALESFLDRHAMSWVEVRGSLDRGQIRSLYARSSIYAAPATLESFGIAALEARCAGVPVVAKTGNGIAEFVHDGRDGLLVADDHAMTQALIRLCTQPLLRRALAGHAEARTSPVSWSTTLELTEAAYDEAAILAGRVAPRAVEVAS